MNIKNKYKLFYLTFNIMILVLLICSIEKFINIKEASYIDSALNIWRGSSHIEFNQYSVFLSTVDNTDTNKIKSFRKNAYTALESMREKDEKSKLSWVDCYMSRTDIDVSSKLKKATLNAYGIGGEYFLFHPLPLLSGNYLSEKDISDYGVVLDECAAWQLFGSTDIVGKLIKIENTSFIVSGIIAAKENIGITCEKQNEGNIYFHYKSLNRLSTLPIVSYEIIFPEPLKGFTHQLLTQSFSIDTADIIKNHQRFSVINLLKKSLILESQLVQEKEISYPNFENSARVTEYRLIKILWQIILLSLIELLNGIVLVLGLKKKLNIKERWQKYIGKCNVKKYKQDL